MLLFSGASIRACKAFKRHVLALEADKDLVDEVLCHLIPVSVEVDSIVADSVEDSSRKGPLEINDDEPEIKTALKKACK